MLKHPAVTQKRIERFAHRLSQKLYTARAPVELKVFHAPGRISYDEAMQGEYVPLQVGDKLGPHWSTHWVEVQLEIPEIWSGREVHFLWDSSSEACVWMDGLPRQGLTGSEAAVAGESSPIRAEYILAREARGGDQLTFHLEIACNSLVGVRENSGVDLMGLIRQAEIASFDRDMWDLYWDFVIIQEMAVHLPDNTPRGRRALYVANEIANLCDPEDASTWPACREVAAAFLGIRNSDDQHQLSAIGHAHIDSAWLWPRAETKRKCYRTFSTVLRYLEDYPDYLFSWSQACQYEWLEQEYPQLFDQLKAAIAKGQIVPVGGSWVEPDCNLPSGESLVRQFLFGQQYFERTFGERCRVFWNPDVFGYSGQLPQIMRNAGIDYFLTQKLSWNQFNKMPSHTFTWEGIDGTSVLTHFPPADSYNAVVTVEQLLYNVSNFKDLERANESYMLFGYGDGGGGPTRGMLERIKRCEDVAGLPKLKMRNPDEFFARCDADIEDPLVWVGELYFELHRGTYTTQARTKHGNRKGEILLHDAEFVAAMAGILADSEYPAEALGEAWKLLLFNQFHDVLPGSSIGEVYRDAWEDYQQIQAAGQQIVADATAAIFEPGEERVAAINSLTRPRREIVTLPDGEAALVTAPGLGWAICEPVRRYKQEVTLEQQDEGVVLENPHLRAKLNAEGALVSLIHKETGREAIAPGQTGNRFVLFRDTPNLWHAWDVDIHYLEREPRQLPGGEMTIVEQGPLRVAVRFTHPISERSSLVQTVTLTAIDRRLAVDCEVSWFEDEKFLKVEFPFNIRASQATYEIQFGHLERPTHFNNSWDMARFEVCGHRWADLAEPDFGVALLNDCKYGYATLGNVMRLSLLRAPLTPDPEADRGDYHRFSYAVMPHAGSFQEAGVIDEAARFNVPLQLVPTAAEAGQRGFFEVDAYAIMVDTVKRSEDGKDLILRLYEAHGTRGTCHLTSTLPIAEAWHCNLLEDCEEPLTWDADEGAAIAYTPFQVQTIRLRLGD